MAGVNKKRRIPTKAQWLELRSILGNGYGSGDYYSDGGRGDKRKGEQAIRSFELWLESRYQIKFSHYLTGTK